MPERQTAIHHKTDEELIADFQAGNLESFTLIVGRYKDQLMNFVYRYVGDYDDADDIVQDVFVRVYRNKNAYKPIAKFSTWIYTIATNLAKTELRRRKRHSLFSLNRGRDEQQEKQYDIPDSRYPADGEADRSLKQELIQRALNSLGGKYREILILCDVQDLSYEEICGITGLNMGTVKSRLNRGRAKLQVLLKDLLDE
ncbi:MAG: sigma-70 family RNA polymerase sigma factor [Ignavibacteriae bacterium]|nr:sigma-70 family RNA polymerase sigma factor [Ignavibacteria bacterium]MBI3365246.1 sigma-70 family RNA polymerase sigma factor [Ignavibacteriota bacterium]